MRRQPTTTSSFPVVVLNRGAGINSNLMCGSNGKTWALAVTLIAAAFTSTFNAPGAAITTNWVAFNDHRPGPTPPPPGGWGTALRVTPYDMRVGPGGTLTNFLTGSPLSVGLTVTATGAPDDFGTCFEPNNGTPAALLFKGIVDVANNNSVIGVRFTASTATTLTFSGLNASKHYVFRGTSARGGGYALRWTVATLMGAQGWLDAHLNGTGPGVITSNNFPADLGAGQAAYDSGDNSQGAVVGWDFITPAPDGSFSIQSSNYVGHVPGGNLADKTVYGYAVSAFLLAEVEIAAPAIVTQPVTATNVPQNRPFSLSVTASGTPLFYQWYRQGFGQIPGATLATYSVANASVGDSGFYYAVVSNPLANVTSTLAQVTVSIDNTPPGIVSAFTYPTFDPSTQIASMNQVIVEFNEPVQPGSATDTSGYLLSDMSMPASVVMTNDHTVVLNLSEALADDTAYTVTVKDVLDIAGNNISNGGTNNPAPFRSWMRGPANGLLFEAFNSGAGVTVDVLTNSPVFPSSPFLRSNLYAFDTRVVYPDDTQHATGVGSRIRGVFVPPVSGDWNFFLRAFDRGNFYFNPNGTDPAGAQFVFAEVTGNNPRDWNKFISPAYTLKAGHGYYVESLQQADAGTGTDVIKVAARLVGTGVPPLGIPDTVVDTNSMMGSAVASPYAPRDLGGALTLVQDLADVQTEENNPVTFSLPLNNPSGLPLQYQWFRNLSPISGANGPTYTIQQPKIATDNGVTFSAQVAKVGSVVTTRTATLTVVKDVTPPRLLQVFSSFTNLSSLLVQYNEPMNVVASGDQFNYNVTGPTAPNVYPTIVFDSLAETATLLLDAPLLAGETYQMDVQYSQDIAGNVIIETNVTFVAGSDVPKLAISFSDGYVYISWPAPSTGFVLEQADPTGPLWTPEGSTPAVAGGRNTVTITLPAASKVYRLHQP